MKSLAQRLDEAISDLPSSLRGLAEENRANLARVVPLDVESIRELILDPEEPVDLRCIGIWCANTARESSLRDELEVVTQTATDASLIWESTKALVALGASSHFFVELLTESQLEERRKAAIWALGSYSDIGISARLIEIVLSRDESTEIRSLAAESLGYIADRSAFESLSFLVNEDDPELRYWGAFALGNLGDRRAVPILEHMAETDDGRTAEGDLVRDIALESLSDLASTI